MFKSRNPEVHIYIPQSALDVIFDECDRYDVDETGGRIIGNYQKKGNKYTIEVLGILDPGPNAKRTATSFFQDGEYQEKIFRSVEEKYPHIEHLGSWHTHHVNGLTTLSSGDRATYQRIVNHHMHNTDFFYALLVVEKKTTGQQRYTIKHYFLRRKDSAIYEISDSQVHVINKPLIWPISENEDLASSVTHGEEFKSNSNHERVKDQEFFADFHPSFRPLFSKKTNVFYWKGKLNLIDDSILDMVVMENQHDGGWKYSIAGVDQRPGISDILTNYKDRTFKSARIAVFNIERELNQQIYLKKESLI